MKRICLMVVVMLGSQAFAKGPTKIYVLCKIGSSPETLVSLQDCGNKIDAYEYGPYWCSGKIDDNFSAKFTGYSGTGSGEIRITYVPMKFIGISPIEIGDQKVSCRLPNSN